MRAAGLGAALVFGATLAGIGCGGTLDAGHDGQHGLLPVDDRNPVLILQDDWSGDWLPELAVMYAGTGRLTVAGVVVNSTPYWPDLAANTTGWMNLMDAARSSGLTNLPPIISTTGKPLTRPSNGLIESTKPNNSEGAQAIVSLSRQLSQPFRPLVVVSGTSLTELADAYLVDPTVAERVVVVAALGSYKAPNGELGLPNGDLDPWAAWIVSQKYRFIQVGTYYDQTTDVTADQVASSNLPPNQLGNLMAKKQPRILTSLSACDQVALLSVAVPKFVLEAVKVSADVSAGFDETKGTTLVPDEKGNDMVVTKIQGPTARVELWGMLMDPHTFGM
ncbi:MAG TPA: hypothetical protein VIU64_12310 [Polyangia bacterium]